MSLPLLLPPPETIAVLAESSLPRRDLIERPRELTDHVALRAIELLVPLFRCGPEPISGYFGGMTLR
ncbi:MAG: hypothetical protein AB7G47_19520 [Mycolicibacterium sp.]|uniref:hypothetical protein n=1 Tax=Mycolicibacterium sp. TaxID=2320850 RepID=UPI003D150801